VWEEVKLATHFTKLSVKCHRDFLGDPHHHRKSSQNGKQHHHPNGVSQLPATLNQLNSTRKNAGDFFETFVNESSAPRFEMCWVGGITSAAEDTFAILQARQRCIFA